MSRLVVSAFALSLAACAAPADPGPRSAAPSTAEWRAAERRLAELRERARGEGARTERVGVAFHGPVPGTSIEARGAIAVEPPSALRMILLGPGGTTAMDVWIRDERYRLAIPAASIARRGDASTPARERRGMPIDFLRFWFLAPFDGRLLATSAAPPPYERRFVLRDGDAWITIDAAAGDGPIAARRAGPNGVETVVTTRLSCGETRYRQLSTGLEVNVRCEGSERATRPDSRAFVDPDAEGP